MYYTNFDDHVTAKYGVVIEGWPLKTFAAPGTFSSIPTLTVLYNSWANGHTSFRSVSDAEWDRWLVAYRNGTHPPGVSMSAWAIDVDEVVETNSDGLPAEGANIIPQPPASNPDLQPPAPESEAATGSTSVTGPSMYSAPVPLQHNPRTTDDGFVNAFVAPDGSGLVMTKKARKQRSDKGSRRNKENRTPAAAASG